MEVIGSLYTEVSDDFQKGIIRGGIARCVKAEKHDLGVVLMNDVKVIGQMDNTIDHTFESANRVYDSSGIAPTVNTCGGGGLQPKILEVKQLGFMDNGTGKHQSNTVYDENALCPNITTIEGGGTQQIKVLETKCLNSKGGRNGIDGLQPSVQDRIYDTNGVSTAITSGFMPNILQESTVVAMRGRNPENPSDRTAGGPTEQRLEMNTQGTSNCLTSVQKDNLVMEKILQTPRGFNNGGVHEICTSISSNSWHENNFLQNRYRIRKLTPRECGRLMGVSDEDISKMAAVNSNSQLYKQFGNSIVVDVMVAMFKNLNIEQK